MYYTSTCYEELRETAKNLSQASRSLAPIIVNHFESRGSSVGIATGYELDDVEVGAQIPTGASMSSRPALGPIQPLIQWVPWGSFPGGDAAEA
jgi:hypothetical protein